MNEQHTVIYGIGVSTGTASAEVVKAVSYTHLTLPTKA